MTTTNDQTFKPIGYDTDDAAKRRADLLARLPRVQITKPRPSTNSNLPAVGSFR